MSLTNAQLSAWYDREVLGNCPHEFIEDETGTYKTDGEPYTCLICGDDFPIDVFHFEDPPRIPDHLSDPAVILGIIKEHNGNLYYHHTDSIWKVDFSVYKIKIVSDKSLERAVMLALKAKVEK